MIDQTTIASRTAKARPYRLMAAGLLRRHWSQAILVILFLVTLVTGWRLVWDVPLYAKPIEDLHAEVVDLIKQTHNLPVASPGLKLEEFHQPPLYYLLVTALTLSDPPMAQRVERLPRNDYFLTTVVGNRNLYLPGDEGSPTLYVGRLIGLVAHLLLVVLVYAQSRLILDDRLSLLATALVALHPQLLFIDTAFDNDSLAVLSVAAAIWWLTRLMVKGVTPRRAFLLGILLGIGLVCKVHAVFLLALIPFLLWLNRSKPLRHLVSWMVLFVLGTLLISGPVLLRNLILYHDALALGSVVTGTVRDSVFNHLLAPLPSLWSSFWLDYSSGMAGYAPNGYYVGIDLILLVAAVGVVVASIQIPRQRVYLAMHAFFVGLVFCFSIYQKAYLLATGLITVPVGEGRHVFIVLPSLAILVAAAVQALPRYRLRLIAAGGLAALALAALLWAVYPHADMMFGLAPTFGTPALSTLNPPIRFENGMELAAFRVWPGQVNGASGWWTALEWTTDRPIDRNLSVSVQLLEWKQNALVGHAQQDSYPGNGLWPTLRWQPGIHVFDRQFIRSVQGTQLGIFIYDRQTGKKIETTAHQIVLFPLSP